MRGFTLFSTPVGDCGIAWSGGNVVATSLPDITSAATARRLARRTGATAAVPPQFIHCAIEAITRLLGGERTDLTFITCDFGRVDPFARSVYNVVRGIPAGETATYGDVGSRLGSELLARKVGKMLGRNPCPIIVPCHRVVGAGGKLTGFSSHGGVETKRKLLTIEGACIKGSLELFR